MEYTGYIIHGLAGLLLLLSLKQANAQSYKAAVVAYKPEKGIYDGPGLILTNNKQRYVDIISTVKNMADIIIFPEGGLTTFDPKSKPRDHLDSYSLFVPNPGESLPNGTILADLREAAKVNRIYVVVNILEKVEVNNVMKFYSSNVVFDSEGKLIAKCRKKHLLDEISYEKGDLQQACSFDAKFSGNGQSIKFDLLFDTDILFYTPKATVSNIILTSSLKNMLPLSYGISLQVAFSIRNKVNLLVSGYTDVENGYGGTGIYFKNGTSRVSTTANSQIIYDVPNTENKLNVINVNVQSYNVREPSPNVSYEALPTLNTENTTYSYYPDKDNYCTFDMIGNDIKPYKWVGIYDKRKYLGQNVHIIVCTLIKPEEKKAEHKTVNKVTISSVLKNRNIKQVLPFSLGSNMLPASFEFEQTDENDTKKTKMSLIDPDDLSTFGIIFILDDSTSPSSSIYTFHIYPILPITMYLSLKWLV